MGAYLLLFNAIILTHYYISILPMCYCVLTFLSLVYNNRRLTLALAGIGMGCYLANVLVIFPLRFGAVMQPNYVDVCTILTVMLISVIISLRVFESYSELIRHITEVTIKKITLELSFEHRLKMDAATGLFNHSAFYEHLDTFIHHHTNGEIPFSVAVLDIDNFKAANDTYGHAFGDNVIQRLAEIIKDTLPDDCLAHRYGGEEFAVICPGPPEVAHALLETIRTRFAADCFLPNGAGRFTVSVGLCAYSACIGDSRDCFGLADAALYDAKRTGKNKTVVAACPSSAVG